MIAKKNDIGLKEKERKKQKRAWFGQNKRNEKKKQTRRKTALTIEMKKESKKKREKNERRTERTKIGVL